MIKHMIRAFLTGLFATLGIMVALYLGFYAMNELSAVKSLLKARSMAPQHVLDFSE